MQSRGSRTDGLRGRRFAALDGHGPWVKFAMSIAALAILLAALSGSPYWLNILTLTYLFAGLAVAWNLIGGFGGQLALGHGIYFATGAYSVAIGYTRYGWSPWLAMVIAVPIAMVIAAITSWPTFRLRGPFFAMATLALNQVALILMVYFSGFTGGSHGLTVPFEPSFRNVAFIETWKYPALMLVFVAFAAAIATWVSRNRLGYALRAVREDDAAAAAAGFNVFSTKMKAMLVSAGLTSIGGALFACFVRYVDPASVLSLPDLSVRIVLIALLGGIGTVWGPVLGALVLIPGITFIQGSLAGGVSGINLVVVGALLTLIPLLLRRGMVGLGILLLAKFYGRGRK